MDDDVERTESGSPIYRHQPRERDWQLPEEQCTNLEDIENHLEQYIGKVETVFHELLSDLIHLDVLFIPADFDRPFHLLVTSGMSDLPMHVPEGAEEFRRAELMIALPSDWPIQQAEFKDENHYWPIRWLKMIGRLPHEYETWIGWGHTIPNGDPAEPIADTEFVGVMVSPPYWFDSEFFRLKTKSGEEICFYCLIPLYQEEMDLKLAEGAEALEERLNEAEVGFIVDKERVNVAN